ncbi:hypothetical protein [Lewinella sp. 4G2]|uniref:hypothetical protein n=1 Tax=Lewinella sp. 4G2 TaxID=1803372 RepID=UPI0012F9D106|nr:hypothetical protein [Lewinella sp. 4G2]
MITPLQPLIASSGKSPDVLDHPGGADRFSGIDAEVAKASLHTDLDGIQWGIMECPTVKKTIASRQHFVKRFGMNFAVIKFNHWVIFGIV